MLSKYQSVERKEEENGKEKGILHNSGMRAILFVVYSLICFVTLNFRINQPALYPSWLS
jgi:hypothetical protein